MERTEILSDVSSSKLDASRRDLWLLKEEVEDVEEVDDVELMEEMLWLGDRMILLVGSSTGGRGGSKNSLSRNTGCVLGLDCWTRAIAVYVCMWLDGVMSSLQRDECRGVGPDSMVPMLQAMRTQETERKLTMDRRLNVAGEADGREITMYMRRITGWTRIVGLLLTRRPPVQRPVWPEEAGAAGTSSGTETRVGDGRRELHGLFCGKPRHASEAKCFNATMGEKPAVRKRQRQARGGMFGK